MPERGGARTAGEGKKIGRPPKPKIEQVATKGIATDVLAMDGPPDHTRRCSCDVCVEHRQSRCKCIKVHEQVLPAECTTASEHKICHCEVCGWWEALLSTDRRLRKETRVYLTDRRDGKPAQGVFIGDTRESARELDFGDLPELIAPSQPGAARKPN